MQINIKTAYTPKGDYELVLEGKYQDGSHAFSVYDNKEHMFRATVCVDTPAENGNIIIKNWSENEGVYQALVDAGVIHEHVKTHRTGFVKAFECPLTDKTKSHFEIEA